MNNLEKIIKNTEVYKNLVTTKTKVEELINGLKNRKEGFIDYSEEFWGFVVNYTNRGSIEASTEIEAFAQDHFGLSGEAFINTITRLYGPWKGAVKDISSVVECTTDEIESSDSIIRSIYPSMVSDVAICAVHDKANDIVFALSEIYWRGVALRQFYKM